MNVQTMVSEARDSGANPRVHPNGFIQLDLLPPDPEPQKGHSGGAMRLHVWNPPGFSLPHQGTVNEVHDHIFDMHSTVVRGTLIQQLYELIDERELERDSGGPTHEKYRAVYGAKSSSTLQPTGERGKLVLVKEFAVVEIGTYEQPAFTFHNSVAGDGTVVTIMRKRKVYDGEPTVICEIGEPPDNDFDRTKAAPYDLLWQAIDASIEGL